VEEVRRWPFPSLEKASRSALLVRHETMFAAACTLLEAALHGTVRRQIVTDLSQSPGFGRALQRLRDSMQAHVWRTGSHSIDLGEIVRRYDSETREDGFHALHDWDGIADSVNDDIVPVDVLNYLIERRGDQATDRVALAILLDYYFLHILGLLSLRVWDDGDADGNLDRLTHLLRGLQGPQGSGQAFAANAGTLILLATSHFEIHERGYDKLLKRVKTLSRVHQTEIALAHAASLASHLRFGFEATYGRDTVNMRNDNVADYPWLCFSLATLMREYSQGDGLDGLDREALLEGILNGLTPDARAFVGDHPPPSVSACDDERSEFRERFLQHRQELLEGFERHRPSEEAYSPISFFFNFSHNVVKGMVVDALLRGEVWTLTLNDLLTGLSRGAPMSGSKQTLAKTLMGYARSSPNRIRGRLVPVIVYDPRLGRRAFLVTMSKIME
jgi:hypothetical protein